MTKERRTGKFMMTKYGGLRRSTGHFAEVLVKKSCDVEVLVERVHR